MLGCIFSFCFLVVNWLFLFHFAPNLAIGSTESGARPHGITLNPGLITYMSKGAINTIDLNHFDGANSKESSRYFFELNYH